MENVEICKPSHLNFEYQIGWKYYNKIKKKAMEQEFSWAGLVLSLSIAFFVVIASAITLSFIHTSITEAAIQDKFIKEKIYLLEKANTQNYLNAEFLNKEEVRKMEISNIA